MGLCMSKKSRGYIDDQMRLIGLLSTQDNRSNEIRHILYLKLIKFPEKSVELEFARIQSMYPQVQSPDEWLKQPEQAVGCNCL
jgi:hypothetical protein